MAGGMVFAVGDLSPDINPFQKEILGKHVFDIVIYLADAVDVLLLSHCLASFPRIPLIKEALSFSPKLLASSTASLMATPTGISSS